MRLSICPLNPETWELYLSFYGEPLPVPEHCILVQDGSGRVAGGVCLYPCFPYMLVENFALNPELQPSEKRETAVWLAEAVKGFCTIKNLVAITLTKHVGISGVLELCGFVEQDYKVFYALPGAQKRPQKPEASDPSGDGGSPPPGSTGSMKKKPKKRKSAVKRTEK